MSGAPASPPARFTGFDALLYAMTLTGWGTGWFAIKLQLGTVAPEISVIWRFAIAAAIMFALAFATGARLAFGRADHLRFAAIGLLMFSMNFVLFYYGAMSLPSGLLSVVFSLASVFNVLLAALLLGAGIERKVLAGAVAGTCGIALMFWPEVSGTEFDWAAAAGLVLCIAGTLLFCVGNIVSARTQARQRPVLAANAWGMLYGVALLTALAAAQGTPFTIDWSARYLGSLLWLAIASSVMAYWAYVTLLGRIGPARAGYITVLFPPVALMISTVIEGYVWTLPAIIGLALVLGGNLLVLARPAR